MSRFPEFLRPIAFLLTLSVLSCSEEEVAGPPINDFQRLTQRDHVIQNLEASYQEGDIAQVERVLDNSFSFCFTLDSTRCWPRGDELSITGEVMAAGGIEILFSYVAGEQKWIANTTNPRSGEAIWEKLINYSIKRERSASGLTVETGRATFLIRRVRFEDANRWRLTGIADHTGPWGEMKEQFLPEN